MRVQARILRVRTRILQRVVLVMIVGLGLLGLPQSMALAAGPCDPGSNPVECENSQPGTPMEDWYSPGAWGAIEGFTDQVSYRPGDTIRFRVKSPVQYHIRIYRLGWYNGDGARLMPTSPSGLFPASNQGACSSNATTGLVDCGNWTVTGTWTLPSGAVSGLYLAELDQNDGNGLMPYPFVVRDETSHSDIVLQTSDQTWQAYNAWGGRNFYDGNGPAPDGRAYKVSYNRPLSVAGDNGIFGSEYAMIRWLERNGYDLSYLSGIDVSTRGSLLLNHKVFMSSGHDEYWNQAQWDNVATARVAGVNLAFFSGNEVFWRTRLEPSIDGSATPDRTLVCYKMTKLYQTTPNGIPDPTGTWTGTWMDPHGAGTGGGKPQNQLTGTLFMANGYRFDAMTVPAAYGKMRLWRNTSVANLIGNQVAQFQNGTLGYEWDVDADNGVRPPGAIGLSSTTIDITDGTLLQDYGNSYGNGTATHSLVEYRDQTSGALVFGSGTVQWSWGLDTIHVADATTEDVRLQQATVNLLADMGVQPTTLQSNLVAATRSTDTTGPTVTVTSPAAGASVPVLAPVTITGTATDTGGGQLARVEVSTDNGTTWQAATGLATWTYSWTPTQEGAAQIKVRAVDDSVNVGAVTTLSITVGPQECPCTIWPANAAPTVVNAGDNSAVELGVKFRTTAAASATGVRFYKSTANTGTHRGNLWTASGQLLATGTFTGESASGWQTLTFASPVPLKPNTTYIASYLAPNGGYSADGGYFSNKGAGLAPLKALQSGVDGGNGVFRYGAGGGFSTQTYNATNYWVDVVVDTDVASTTTPTVTAVTPSNGATGVSIASTATATFSTGIDTDTLQFTLKDPANVTVPASVSYDTATQKATLTPTSQLALSTAYTASVSASDLWGNAMSAPYTWSFTTSATPPPVTCPCSIWPSATTPATVDSGDPNAVELGTRFTSSLDGFITGVRFYKASTNTGTHRGTLWTNTGTQLATGTFTGESASGWQKLTFSTPVAITANTPYVVSYYTPTGHYSANAGYFSNHAQANYPLTGLADGTSGANGLYRYGTASSPNFPTGSYGSANYWVDPVFTTTDPNGGGAAPAPPGTFSNLSVTFADPVDPSSVQMTVTAQSPPAEADAGTTVPGTVSYNPKSGTATFHPVGALVPLTRYQVVAKATDRQGHAVKPVNWQYTAPRPEPKERPPGRYPRPGTPAAVAPSESSSPPRRSGAVPTGK
jgi:hypothetical protein